MVDADVPGTEVYLNQQKLGVVPLRFSPAQLNALGLPQQPPGRGPVDFDGWGEGVFFGTEDEQETKLMCFRTRAATT